MLTVDLFIVGLGFISTILCARRYRYGTLPWYGFTMTNMAFLIKFLFQGKLKWNLTFVFNCVTAQFFLKKLTSVLNCIRSLSLILVTSTMLTAVLFIVGLGFLSTILCARRYRYGTLPWYGFTMTNMAFLIVFLLRGNLKWNITFVFNLVTAQFLGSFWVKLY